MTFFGYQSHWQWGSYANTFWTLVEQIVCMQDALVFAVFDAMVLPFRCLFCNALFSNALFSNAMS